ncbi:MAG: glycine--tRNA ligase [Parcubacteria group bacterium CG2_30_36_21]|uniref:glycine--tRNA ligase n=3 Tax=Candidatus Gribaldobacteria TaxID=2798536 RepID=A0A2H0UW89_9BACT|nr:MAG: glycine--tRNA ligase [Parcubacteria group bacterium CG2_30_36_21]PIR91102.1 MAG: glycine--tRNA ligase [bacterium (Candidatus Gribaldobacteria) CG10_big_fil_rev_8_21_14_0_10_37_46]PIV14053.1 MAG: glycine--tRNA ligase [bacterium (Candidatus Gribaldobacteria) CG03_land_8_20_14_0_80_36_40]
MDLTQKIISLCKRRGIIFPSSEIYEGFGGVYDFGPLGVELKNNLKKVWWEEMINKHKDIVGLDAAVLMNPRVWQASGHLSAGFADELLECKDCRKRFKLDEIQHPMLSVCPECGGKLSEPRKFNLMIKTFIGPVENEAAVAYLRPETCQGIYINFLNVMNSMRLKIPFGMAQIGKAFRNEINPKNFIFRTREFEQMEMEWFCRPKEANKYFDYWKEERLKWYYNLGIKKENLRAKEIPEEKRAHYAKRQIDIEYHFPFGWGEIEGVHNRGDWDLKNHSEYSGKDLSYTEEGGDKYYPYIVETSVGVERSLFAFLSEAYQEVKGGRTTTTESAKAVEILLKLPKSLAPIKVAALPLVRNKPELVKKAKEVYQLLKPHFVCQYDEIGSIGRRYRRQDEIGTCLCLTVDFESLKQDDLTIRNRDTMKQERVKIKDLIKVLSKFLEPEAKKI